MENHSTETVLTKIYEILRDSKLVQDDGANRQDQQPVIKDIPEADKWFDLDQFCGYVPGKPAKPTVYGWVNRREVPHHKKGKKLYFLKSEIDDWLKKGRRRTVLEIDAETDNYLTGRKNKRS